jgi:farnesyl-diphosphate farnesyltransferase
LSDTPLTVTALPFRDDELADFLERTSRTFALAIPLLEEPLRREVGLGYLLLRVADTLEDAAPWSREERREALAGFEALLQESPDVDAGALSRGWLARRPSEDAGYLDLLSRTPSLMASLDALRTEAGAILRHFVLKTVRGMRQVLEGASEGGRLELDSLQALREYCYIVAGLVGELLTELFVLDARLAPYSPNLRSLAPLFGEGLQLVNILKDARKDQQEGRVWLPGSVRLQDVERLAGEDLVAAARYVRALHLAGAPQDVLAFTTLPLLLARATLELLVRDGAGAKVSRAVVNAQMDTLQAALSRGTLPEAVEALAGPAPGGP